MPTRVKNFYAVLSLPENATSAQIRERFRELVRTRHPDRFHGEEKAKAEIEFQEITQALNVLINPELRRQHDLELKQPTMSSRPSDPSQLARVYLSRGAQAYRTKDYLAAAENFDRATKAQPDNAKAWHRLALATSHQERWLPRAAKAAVKACELEPINATYLELAASLFERRGMPEKALEYFERALEWGGEPALEERVERLRKATKRRGGFFGRIR